MKQGTGAKRHSYSRQLLTSLMLLGLLFTSTFALAQVGKPLAWGYNGNGQLGEGTTTDQKTPVQVLSLIGVVQVSVGFDHSLALKSDGTVWAWGYNGNGQLGEGTTTDKSTPVSVSGLTGIVQVATGYYHSLAVKSDGTLWAWGYNLYGQLGEGTNSNRNSPVQVSGLTGVVQVAAGLYHSLALRTDGTVWAWGNNSNGQLGNGATASSNAPVQVKGLSGVTQVAAGESHSLALKSDGTVWAWGNNSNGQLGEGTGTGKNSPVQVSGLTGVVQVSAGGLYSLALESDGTVRAWGANNYGQLGEGTYDNRNTPVPVSGLTGVVQVSGGYYHALAIKSDGVAWAWGYDLFSALGDGSSGINEKRNAPVQVLNITNQTYISAGGYHSLSVQAVVQSSKIVPAVTSLQYGTKTISTKLINAKFGNPLCAEAIALSLDGNGLGNSNTDASGTATLPIINRLNYGLGAHSLGARFAGDRLFKPYSRTININIIKADTNLTPTKPSVFKYGTTKPFSALLKRNSDGAKLGNQLLTFKIDGVQIGQPTTDGTGQAAFDYKLEESLPPGKHTYSVDFVGDALHNPTSASIKFSTSQATTTLSQQDSTGTAGKSVILYGRLKRDTDKKMLEGRTITFTLDGAVIGTATTVAGLAKLVYKLPSTTTKGAHSLAVMFAGDDYYYGSSYSAATITVN